VDGVESCSSVALSCVRGGETLARAGSGRTLSAVTTMPTDDRFETDFSCTWEIADDDVRWRCRGQRLKRVVPGGSRARSRGCSRARERAAKNMTCGSDARARG
jgi:hypothetical protein